MVDWRRGALLVVGFVVLSVPYLLTYRDIGVGSLGESVLFVTGSVVGGITLGIGIHQRSVESELNETAVTYPLDDVVREASDFAPDRRATTPSRCGRDVRRSPRYRVRDVAGGVAGAPVRPVDVDVY